ncbi:MAG: hypothetical protein KF851_04590 [Pirellulaceae bacterium]|nr:hypothetical protein [Pirellulaceae bacterium]
MRCSNGGNVDEPSVERERAVKRVLKILSNPFAALTPTFDGLNVDSPMEQFTFPSEIRDSILEWIAAIPDSSVEQMKRATDRLPDSTWHNYRCRVRDAIALITISEQQQLPGKILVSVSPDLRRLWRLTKLFGDFRLSIAISDILKRQGGMVSDE